MGGMFGNFRGHGATLLSGLYGKLPNASTCTVAISHYLPCRETIPAHIAKKESCLMPIRLVALLFSFALTGAGTAQAQSYPSRPIKVVVPFAAGGPQDGIIRMLSETAAAGMGQSFVIENKARAGGLIAADQVAKAPADGHVLLKASWGAVVVAGDG